MLRMSNADALRAFIDDVMADFRDTPTRRDLAAFAADDGETVEVELSPLEEFVVEAALYSVPVALLMLPDENDRKGNPFTR